MFFAATLIDIYEVDGDYLINCTIDNHSKFNFIISKNNVYGTPFIGTNVSGNYDDNQKVKNILIE
ncbi:hypothetical protein [Bacillus cereus]|uniref:hypothetical protein n=1 Tax=Bacillus cereus TaxID=1396 RepID=UPI0025B08089|nr:hypothetical protein [Bacillus cereus]WJX08406.1 hypothetical protein QTA68_29045 [Bacillus cereus]